MVLATQHLPVIFANICLATAILVFAVGFFPHKAVLPGLATWPVDTPQAVAASPFNKLIFMVVDALRSDFVYSNDSSFHFTQSLIRSGAAVPFTGHASPPTITMPRVKAITTGSVPSFIDLILNFAESDTSSTLAHQDSWLAQMKAKGDGKLVMFGDDTWLRLFPDFFERSDGTTSFFVSDFTEVDHNVTRNIPDELKRDDWSVMVMHYLGLDHIGHKTGPQGPNMPAKQREMDEIVRQIYTAMGTHVGLESCLFVLLGDHGMNEAGNHGGSSAGETSTALTFISSKFETAFGGFKSPLKTQAGFSYYGTIEQSDIAVTLAALLGFPIPRNSLGILIPQLLELWTSEKDRFDLLFANAEQMVQIAQATFSNSFDHENLDNCHRTHSLSEEDQIGCQWQKTSQTRQDFIDGKVDAKYALAEVSSFLKVTQALLSSSASKYDLNKMGTGVGLAGVAWLLSLFSARAVILEQKLSAMAFFVTLMLYSVTMFASSYVEEEHQFWYWTSAAWFTLLFCRSSRIDSSPSGFNAWTSAVFLLAFGLVRRWNQTGQKYAGEVDLVTEMVSQHPWLLWALTVATYAYVSRRLSRRARQWGSKQMAVLPALVGISAFLFKLTFTAADAPELLRGITIFDPVLSFMTQYPLSSVARIVFFGCSQLLATAFFYEGPWTSTTHQEGFMEAFHDVLSLVLMTQSRTLNIPIFLLFYAQLNLLKRNHPLKGLDLTLTSLFMQYLSFFALGGTNAISSVDLSNAYNGVSGYNVVAVGVLTFVSNWVGPIWWSSATCYLASRNRSSNVQPSHAQPFVFFTVFATGSTWAVMIACMVLREHLFIWTVFSPKYLYVMAWTFAQHFVINGVLGTLLSMH